MQQLHGTSTQLADGDFPGGQRQRRIRSEYLKTPVLPTDGPIPRHGAGFLDAKDLRQIGGGRNGLMRIMWTGRRKSKTLIKSGKEIVLQINIGRADVVYAQQAHFLDQSVLENPIAPFYAPLGLW